MPESFECTPCTPCMFYTHTKLLGFQARLLRLMNDERFPKFCNLLTWCWVYNLLDVILMKNTSLITLFTIITDQKF